MRDYTRQLSAAGIRVSLFIDPTETSLSAAVEAGAPVVESGKFSTVNAARIAWSGSGQLPNPMVTDAWTTQEWVHFLEGMPDTLKPEQLKQLDEAYKFTGTANGEIAMRWPRANPFTSRPTSSITPETSCPSTMGSGRGAHPADQRGADRALPGAADQVVVPARHFFHRQPAHHQGRKD